MDDALRARIRASFVAAVNMSAAEIEEWLEGEESRRVGFTREGESESVGRQAGRQTARILGTPEPELGEADYRHMRRVAGFVKRHRAQEPANPVTSRWRWSLMNWGHDPLRD
jgi:hypothetical protein